MAVQEPHALAKTTRINALFDFYEPLLTEKQRTFLKYYFLDDYSLGEIASESGISRQAVYEHIKRAQNALEEYESKLKLLERHERVSRTAGELAEVIHTLSLQDQDKQLLKSAIDRLMQME
ncbi:YlxM family DNA-binding protein [Paenibacillus protaetiae]|uniref:UPF0122 protein ET464_03440 n=1 Tax=Paenibacillus protaetiae TaxID=2509456 RepID=A0A4P6ET35_9BACL|nr:YlxM family DNA-binding protein [Paenibacillus protaetiae]QAY65575.1 DNA-binding protein [Paenibacillus protaetiae]